MPHFFVVSLGKFARIFKFVLTISEKSLAFFGGSSSLLSPYFFLFSFFFYIFLVPFILSPLVLYTFPLLFRSTLLYLFLFLSPAFVIILFPQLHFKVSITQLWATFYRISSRKCTRILGFVLAISRKSLVLPIPVVLSIMVSHYPFFLHLPFSRYSNLVIREIVFYKFPGLFTVYFDSLPNGFAKSRTQASEPSRTSSPMLLCKQF